MSQIMSVPNSCWLQRTPEERLFGQLQCLINEEERTRTYNWREYLAFLDRKLRISTLAHERLSYRNVQERLLHRIVEQIHKLGGDVNHIDISSTNEAELEIIREWNTLNLLLRRTAQIDAEMAAEQRLQWEFEARTAIPEFGLSKRL
jgi:hypothetical protein